MGYYTKYELKITPEINADLESALLDEDGNCNGGLMCFVTGDADECKWYDHEKEMRKFSARFPDYLFALDGEGEESGDIWTKYFKAGRMQKCMATIVKPPYDESLLS